MQILNAHSIRQHRGILLLSVCLLIAALCTRTVNSLGFQEQTNNYYNTSCASSNDCGYEFLCLNGTCVDCNTNNDCYDLNPTFTCQRTTILYHNGTDMESRAVQMCKLKPLWPFNVEEIIGIVICFIGGGLASSTGIGGGGIFVPILLLLMNFTYPYAVPLSTVMIFGTSSAILLFTVRQQHPVADRPIIDYSASLLFLPFVLVGSTAGAILNLVFPSWLISIAMVVFMLFTAIRTFSKARGQWKKENEQRAKAKQKQEEEAKKKTTEGAEVSINDVEKLKLAISDSQEIHAEDDHIEIELGNSSLSNASVEPNAATTTFTSTSVPTAGEQQHPENTGAAETVSAKEHSLITSDTITITSNPTSPITEHDHSIAEPEPIASTTKLNDNIPLVVEDGAATSTTATDDPALKASLDSIMASEKSKFQIWKWLGMALTWLIVALASLVVGGKGMASPLGIKQCSWIYWLTYAILFTLLFVIAYTYAAYLRYMHSKKLKVGYKYLQGDIQWTTKNTLFLPVLSLGAGIIAGLLGLGGGLVTGPLLLELGAHAQVATATSSFMIFVTAASNIVQFTLMGTVTWQYLLFYYAISVISGIIFHFIVHLIVKLLKRSSFIIFLLAVIICISMVLMLAVGIYKTYVLIATGQYLGFHNFCK